MENQDKKVKNIGIPIRVEKLGRIMIPKEIRNKLNINDGDKVIFYIEDEKIILMKEEIKCIFCGGNKELREFSDKKICKECEEKIRREKYE